MNWLASLGSFPLLPSLLCVVLVQLLQNVRVEEWLLRTLGTTGIEEANFAETFVFKKALPDIVILLDLFEV